MFDINKIRPKSILGPVKAQKFSRCLLYKIPLAQTNFQFTLLKINLYWQALVSLIVLQNFCNGLLPDSTKPLPEPMLTNSQWGLWKSSEGIFKGIAQDIYPWFKFTNR